MRIEAYLSTDGRLRTAHYRLGGDTRFCVAERTGAGTLVTEFRSNGEVLDQLCVGEVGAEAALREHLKGVGEVGVSRTGGRRYEPVRVSAACAKCGGGVSRELDLRKPAEIDAIPVVPIFVCRSCKSRHYLLTDEYLGKLVKKNPELFGKDELGERDADERAFIGTLQEYVIRIFASKRISKLKIG
jgi:hypothetical protein